MAGETPRRAQIKTFKCPSCGAPQSVRGMGQTNTYACTSCATIIDISNPEYRILQAAQRDAPTSPIALGTRGAFKDTKYEVIGYMVRCDSSGQYFWDEYLLFNPYKGFVWLTQYNGHWNFVTSLKTVPALTGPRTLQFNGANYDLFIDDRARVRHVVGEFYWQVKVGDAVQVQDYINPPYVLSLERDQSEQVWSFGEYMTPEEIQEAFNFKNELPAPEGVGGNQPYPGQAHHRAVVAVGILFALGLLFLQILSASSAKRRFVHTEKFSFGGAESSPASILKSEAFQLTGHTGNLEVTASAPVDNNWLYLDLALVNADSNDDDEGALEVSYYHGYDQGYWSEGGRSASYLFSGVDPGRYYLTMEPQSGAPQTNIPFQLTVQQDVPYWGNYLLATLLIALVPLLMVIRKHMFETKRWADSSFADDEEE